MFIVGMRKSIQNSGQTPVEFSYINETVKFFEDEGDAGRYRDYINGSSKYAIEGYSYFSLEVPLYGKGELDIDELIRQDALNRLTPEERRVLGL